MYKTILIISILLLTSNSSYTQSENRNQRKHNNIVTISGKEYIIHIVKKGETLFNISKQYNTLLDSVVAANPLIDISTLETGSPVKIPYHRDTRLQTEKYSTKTSADTIYHIVKKGETAYSISRVYGITPADIYAHNKGTDSVMSIDRELIIIKLDSIKTQNQSAAPYIPKSETSGYIYHTVLPKETLYGISRLYNITVQSIIDINSTLVEREIQIGEELKIPVQSSTNLQPPITDTTPLCDSSSTNRSVIDIALMLPFYTHLLVDDSTSTKPKIPERSRQFVEFYQGVLLALEDLKNMGLQANLTVYDTQNDTKTTSDICNSPKFHSHDLIIGPAFIRNLEIVAQAVKELNIPLVSPLSVDDKIAYIYENSFMISPSVKVLNNELIKAVTAIQQNNFVVVLDGVKYDSLYISQLKQAIYNTRTPENVNEVKYTEFSYRKGMEQQLIKLFTSKDSSHSDKDTIVVIIPSEDKAFISDIVARLNTLNEQCDIILFGQPRWAKFDNIKLEFFHNLNTHLFSLNYVDYKSEKVRNFVIKYRQTFGTEPPTRSFEGYDITFYFVRALMLYGKDFKCCLKHYNPELLNMKFDFHQVQPQSGYINNHMYLIHYKRNYSQETVNYKIPKFNMNCK